MAALPLLIPLLASAALQAGKGISDAVTAGARKKRLASELKEREKGLKENIAQERSLLEQGTLSAKNLAGQLASQQQAQLASGGLRSGADIAGSQRALAGQTTQAGLEGGRQLAEAASRGQRELEAFKGAKSAALEQAQQGVEDSTQAAITGPLEALTSGLGAAATSPLSGGTAQMGAGQLARTLESTPGLSDFLQQNPQALQQLIQNPQLGRLLRSHPELLEPLLGAAQVK